MNVLRTRVIYVSTSSILCAFVQGKLSTSTFRLIISSITFNCVLDAFHKLLILLAMIFLQMSNKVSCIVRLCCFSSPRNSVFAFFALGEFCIFCQSKKLPNNRFFPRHYGHRRQERKTKGTGVLNFDVCQQQSYHRSGSSFPLVYCPAQAASGVWNFLCRKLYRWKGCVT